jgi:hypothetical protein
VVEELIPAKGLEFSLPLSKHGDCSFSATVEPGRSFWRPSIAPVMSGLLVERDGQPKWCGWVIGENQTGPRTFQFQAVEWGAFFARIPAVAYTYTGWNDHDLFRDLITRAAVISGQDPRITMGTTLGATTSDLTINPWDDSTVEGLFTSLGESAGGPEWYFGAAGTHESPIRQLVLGDRLGQTSAQTVLEYVEDTPEWGGYDAPPSITLLGNLFPAGTQVPALGRRGGNVIAQGRTRNSGASSTQAIAVGSGEEKAQLRKTAQATRLLNAGWPRLTRTERYQDVTIPGTLQRHADGDLAATAGLSTGYSLVTLDGDPTADWTQTPRGSSVRVVLDTDVYGAERPVGGPDGFTTRLLSTTVRVADDGPAQIEWQTADVLETL